ncbi:hypothetical protein FNW02_16495 [Komarekiella sp. 'clone 1']|uniref:Uncharacterized protein n=1 Tax=Komarekiella delphini-convector SJRDD-AB1 TaxID=2593771 RepID=A0AA40VRQ6_9NOST|nr:hypothetical protein [Komarekiella delphini-convector SJRDD-AB1]
MSNSIFSRSRSVSEAHCFLYFRVACRRQRLCQRVVDAPEGRIDAERLLLRVLQRSTRRVGRKEEEEILN